MCICVCVCTRSCVNLPNKRAQFRQLNGNAITDLNGISLIDLRTLRTLRLEGNMLTLVPTEALMGLASLEAL